MSRKWIHRPHVEGLASRQAHADLPPGTVERELGKEGFFGPATHMIHPKPPTGWTSWEGPLRPRAFDGVKLKGDGPENLSGTGPADFSGTGPSPWNAHELLFNAHCRFRQWTCAQSMTQLVRNSDGDELLFIHAGDAELFCDYGHLTITTGDYVMLPRGTMWRIECAGPVTMLLIEATGSSYQLPDKGLLGEHAIFDPAMLDIPAIDDAFKAQAAQTAKDWKVVVKRRGALSTVSYSFNPLDALGWHGNLHPVRINVKDIRPLVSARYHLPPSAHTTFVASRFVVCTFAPRPFETDPGAIKVPFFHNNDDYDEVLFYHAGDFFSRDNIHAGMVTLHPCGFTHGPHPKALGKMLVQPKIATDEYAVMIDTRDALEIGTAATEVESTDYHLSWKTT